MHVLYITRKYPPQVGGMERFSADFVQALEAQSNVTVDVIALNKSQLHLVWWIVFALFKGIWLGRKADVIHMGDGVLAWLGVVLKWCTSRPITITVHGLDLTYRGMLYQRYIWSGLKRLQHIIGVSSGTIDIVTNRLGDTVPTSIIANGIFPEATTTEQPMQMGTVDTVVPEDATVLLTVGRLIKRKGVQWFVDQVMSTLPDTIHYVITSTGPQLQAIQQAISDNGLQKRVHIVGRVSQTDLIRWYQRADLFIMPNIMVDNDVEGFGIVAIEAAAQGLPVIAADVPGIQDAVVDGRTGFLVESNSVTGWKTAITAAISEPLQPASVQTVAFQRYDWNQLILLYMAVFRKLI